MVCIYTVGGAHLEMPWIMRGLVQIAGKDTRFFGDINNIKSIIHEGVKFEDLLNFFEGSNIDDLSSSWLTSALRERTLQKSKDKYFQRVFLTFELAKKFAREIQSI